MAKIQTDLKTEQKTDLKKQQLATNDNIDEYQADLKTDLKTEQKMQILRLIKENPKISFIELGNRLGLHGSSVQRRLNLLVKEGKVQRIGSDKGGHWEVMEGLVDKK